MIELATPESAVRHKSVVRHFTDCAMQPGQLKNLKITRSCFGSQFFYQEIEDNLHWNYRKITINNLQWNYRKMTINGHFPIIPL